MTFIQGPANPFLGPPLFGGVAGIDPDPVDDGGQGEDSASFGASLAAAIRASVGSGARQIVGQSNRPSSSSTADWRTRRDSGVADSSVGDTPGDATTDDVSRPSAGRSGRGSNAAPGTAPATREPSSSSETSPEESAAAADARAPGRSSEAARAAVHVSARSRRRAGATAGSDRERSADAAAGTGETRGAATAGTVTATPGGGALIVPEAVGAPADVADTALASATTAHGTEAIDAVIAQGGNPTGRGAPRAPATSTSAADGKATALGPATAQVNGRTAASLPGPRPLDAATASTTASATASPTGSAGAETGAASSDPRAHGADLAAPGASPAAARSPGTDAGLAILHAGAANGGGTSTAGSGPAETGSGPADNGRALEQAAATARDSAARATYAVAGGPNAGTARIAPTPDSAGTSVKASAPAPAPTSRSTADLGARAGSDGADAASPAGRGRVPGRDVAAVATTGSAGSGASATPAAELVATQVSRPARDAMGTGTAASGGAADAASTSDIDRFLNDVAARVRTVAAADGQGLEARLQHPDLGSVRLVVSGQPGDPVHAELIASSHAAADALASALDRATAGHGFAGIDLQIRADTSSGTSTGFGSHDRSERDLARDGRSSGNHGGYDGGRAFDGQAAGDHGRRQDQVLRAWDPTTGPSAPATASSGPASARRADVPPPTATGVPRRSGSGIDLRA